MFPKSHLLINEMSLASELAQNLYDTQPYIINSSTPGIMTHKQTSLQVSSISVLSQKGWIWVQKSVPKSADFTKTSVLFSVLHAWILELRLSVFRDARAMFLKGRQARRRGLSRKKKEPKQLQGQVSWKFWLVAAAGCYEENIYMKMVQYHVTCCAKSWKTLNLLMMFACILRFTNITQIYCNRCNPKAASYYHRLSKYIVTCWYVCLTS